MVLEQANTLDTALSIAINRTGDLAVGDVILAVNGVDLATYTHNDVIGILSSSPSLVLTVQRTPSTTGRVTVMWS